jgi:transcriptional regulator EpsA
MATYGDLDGASTLTQAETEQLILTIQGSLQIRRRYQFYIWAQSRLCAMIPHDILICGQRDIERGVLVHDCFAMFPLPKEAVDNMLHPGDGLLARVAELWNRAERMPCSSEQAQAGAARHAELLGALQAASMEEFLAHGMPSPHDAETIETFFCFARAGAALVPREIKRDTRAVTPRHAFMLELLLPYLHATYQRIVGAERGSAVGRVAAAAPDAPITQREIEILGWVREGKSNHQIGDELGISPLTVKNHVQKILRKLGASNRAQAVSMAIGLRLMPDPVRSAARLPG